MRQAPPSVCVPIRFIQLDKPKGSRQAAPPAIVFQHSLILIQNILIRNSFNSLLSLSFPLFFLLSPVFLSPSLLSFSLSRAAFSIFHHESNNNFGSMNGLLQTDVLVDLSRCNWESTNLTSSSPPPSTASLIEKYVKNCDRKKLKQLCRSRISVLDPLRKHLWIQLARGYKRSTSEPRFDEEIANINVDVPVNCDTHTWKLPSFVDPQYCRYYQLNLKGRKLLQEVLWIIAFKHQEITLCPLLYPIAALFLHYYSISETLAALAYLLSKLCIFTRCIYACLRVAIVMFKQPKCLNCCSPCSLSHNCR